MLTYTQLSFMGNRRSVHAVNLISKLLGKSGKALMFLFSPEDTTDNEGKRQFQIAKHNAYHISALTKAVFWVAISISTALLIGRLS